MAEAATAAGVSAETLRKIETGRPSTPAFFAVAALAAALHASLDELAATWAHAPDWPGVGGAAPWIAQPTFCGTNLPVIKLP
jgi:transcriptional regulator with XRE-family HTH domain